MNLGKNILQLRRERNVTQEELAAELGVTAAAVSKWENGYTLPDLLMLCALADYFQITTDTLLGRTPQQKYAVIAAESQDLGCKIAALAKDYGFITKQIYTDYAAALDVVNSDQSITHLFVSFDTPLSEEDKANMPKNLCCIESHSHIAQNSLGGFEFFFRNISDHGQFISAAKA